MAPRDPSLGYASAPGGPKNILFSEMDFLLC